MTTTDSLYCSNPSRNIIVFSAQLSAFTIPHDAANKPEGPDLLVSYHDNDHYNSVRDYSIHTKPPPLPVKEFEYCNGVNGEQKEQEVEVEYIADNMPEQSTEGKASKRPTKKSAPCPCESGLRYKKCCWQRERHAARLRQRIDVTSEEEEEKETAMIEGGFRVLRI